MLAVNLHAQSLAGYSGYSTDSRFRDTPFSSVETGGYLFPVVNDLVFSGSFGSEFSAPAYNSINFLSAGKRLNRHFFYLRYTPGITKEFDFPNANYFTGVDSIESELKTKINYSEIAGAAYSYSITPTLSAGISVRYFTQKFLNDIVGVVFTSDTLYLFSESEAENMSMLKADIGIGYLWSDNLRFSLLSDNLLTLKDGVISEINNRYIMKTPLKFRFAAHYQPLTGLNLSGIIGTGGDFYFNSDYSLDLFNGRLFFGGGFFSSVSGERLNALTISAGFGTENWGLSVTGFNYLNDENKFSLIDFNESAISDIYHNRYSSNKLNAGIYYRINRVQERYAEITELKIVRNIFTGLGDMYLTEPFAMAKVYNFSDEAITLRPSSKIEGINSEPVYSELVRVNPGDTALVKFYTIVNEKDLNANPRISSAEFSIYTLNDTPDDTRQIPVLIHGKNSWDGNVSNLRYFALSEMDYSLKFAREILSGYKNQLDTIPPALSGYYKARMVYDEVVRNLQYVSDPNANTDRVQYPSETIKLKGGDCDDLSVLFSSLFESIGIETAFVDYKSESGISHVNLLFNTGLAPEFTGLITENDKKYYIRKDAAGREYVWLPLEATILKGFDHAWETGSEKFYEEAISGYGLLKNKVEIIEVY
ncbi:MAG: transglutaminase domain-containing protein [Ignavibacteriaceae bacterium]|nr:transglutaminase domain-containing protein [Ignavibacteriaceae bacterium]